MYWYLFAALLATWALLSIEYTRGLIKKYKALKAELKEKTDSGYYPKVEIDKIINEFIEDFKEENADGIMYTQMAEGIKNGSLDVVGAEGIVMISQEEYERLEKCDQLITKMNEVKKEKAN